MDTERVFEAVKTARLLHWQRLSCSEAVWLALNSDMNEDYLRFGSKLAVGFAGGIASGSLCGAVAGGVLAISARFAHYPEEVRRELVRELEERYYKEVTVSLGSAYCRDLKPDDETQRRVCNQIIATACGIAARIIEENKDQA